MKSRKGCRAYCGSNFIEVNSTKKVQRFRNRNGIEKEQKNQRDAHGENFEQRGRIKIDKRETKNSRESEQGGGKE